MMIRLLLLLVCCITLPVAADTSVWRISDGTHQLFLAGTIHVLGKQDYPLPDAYSQAYYQASKLVFETNLDQVSAHAYQEKINAYFSLRDGQTLQSTVSPSTYERLQQYCDETGIPLPILINFKAQYVSLLLTLFQLQKLGIDAAGVDLYFNQLARTDNKPTEELETLEQQLSFLANMGKGREDELLLSTIEENRQLSQLLQTLLDAWRRGDNQRLYQAILRPMKEEFPSIYDDLVVTRNHNWLPSIRGYIATPETEMILVGTLHLVGEDGLINRLRQQGYQITQM